MVCLGFWPTLLCLGVSALVLRAGAAQPSVPPPSQASPNDPAARLWTDLAQRATNAFAEADYYKPVEKPDADLSCKLAPLLLHEVQPGAGLLPAAFGALSLSNGVLVLDRARPTVYVSSDSVRLSGRDLPRFTYLWCYATQPGDSAPPALALQGVRLTLDSAGMPALWEVLADPGPAELIFVSRQLETTAQAQFGPVLPGRRSALERSLNECPRVGVVRILEDGPVPMGPFVYVQAGTRAVTTVLCRCMASEVKHLRHTLTYELTPSPGWLLIQARVLTGTHTTFWPGDEASDQRLARALRLPAKF